MPLFDSLVSCRSSHRPGARALRHGPTCRLTATQKTIHHAPGATPNPITVDVA